MFECKITPVTKKTYICVDYYKNTTHFFYKQIEG
jgi:hypothetical protein